MATSYQWILDGNPINGATNQIYVTSQPGTYVVAITDSNGCVAYSDPILVSSIFNIQAQENIIILSPNPFKENTVIQFTSADYKYDYVFKLYDVLGKEVQEFDVTGSKFKVDRGNLSEGLYIYKIFSLDKQLGIGKLIIQD